MFPWNDWEKEKEERQSGRGSQYGAGFLNYLITELPYQSSGQDLDCRGCCANRGQMAKCVTKTSQPPPTKTFKFQNGSRCYLVLPHVSFYFSHVYGQAMTSIDDLPPPERKRQREALRRRVAQPGLRPGLLAKHQATNTTQGKWEFLKAFLLDPQNLSGVEVETM